jgi:collagenase-like PrtC family protease
MTVTNAVPAKITLGPLLFNWSAAMWRDFYFRVADEAPVDTVHLGEVVCSKRQPTSEKYLADVEARLIEGGKEVVFSSLALVMSELECAGIRRLAAHSQTRLVEANDISAIAALAGRPHVVGPFINVNNEGTLAYLVRQGARRISLPAELPAASIAYLASLKAVEIEVQAFGRLPLALSARCYHARAHGLHKDGCRYVCAEDADGMSVNTMDGEPFLTVNGTQTMSHRLINLLDELDELHTAGVDRFRLWPHSCDMVAVAHVFRDVLDGRMKAVEGNARLAGILPDALFANGYLHGREGRAMVREPLGLRSAN